MSTIKLFTSTIIGILIFSACSKDNPEPPMAVQSQQVSNLYAPQTSDYTTNPPTVSGDFVKFDFSSGAITTSETEWDIAFRGTTILVNGGASSGIADEPARTGDAAVYLANGTFEEINTVTTSSFRQDSANGLAIPTGSGNGWYNYDPMLTAIIPIAGKVIVLKTADGRYAKMEILSYYKDAPNTITPEIASDESNARYYTFNYVYQPNEDSITFGE